MNPPSLPSSSSSRSDGSAVIPSAVPAAEPVERGRFVLRLHNRIDEDHDDGVAVAEGREKYRADAAAEDDDDDDDVVLSPPDSQKSLVSDDIFEDVLVALDDDVEDASDRDLESLMTTMDLSPPSRRPPNGLEMEPSDHRHHRRGRLHRHIRNEERDERKKSTSCPRCPNNVVGRTCRRSRSSTTKTTTTARLGNMIVIFPQCHDALGFGIIGPHCRVRVHAIENKTNKQKRFGPICCLTLLTGATCYLVPKASIIGPLSSLSCILLYAISASSLLVVACTDPGVVRAGGLEVGGGGRHCYAGLPTSNMTAGRGWRFCDLCSVYQPPNAVHCPECNVCIEGYDHHCPWMGTCIGGRNYASFLVFNLTWLFYLVYAILWVSVIGPKFWIRPYWS
ncbi:hypothetical protein ACHAXA_001983 [Cyclostephanos tholiformis]|uniref:Palmitoyltransferase n=1 Tax=Cyclostephanos tholiformis TaxID=382380 RepID=A0ABD3SDB8_9STRA